MIIFELGLGLFGVFLACLTYSEFRQSKPATVIAWGEFGLIIAAQVCVWAVLLKSALS